MGWRELTRLATKFSDSSRELSRADESSVSVVEVSRELTIVVEN